MAVLLLMDGQTAIRWKIQCLIADLKVTEGSRNWRSLLIPFGGPSFSSKIKILGSFSKFRGICIFKMKKFRFFLKY